MADRSSQPKTFAYSTAVNQSIAIKPKAIRGVHACLPGGLLIPANRFNWYYVMRWANGEIAATLHMDQGVVVHGHDALWRVGRHDGIRTLTMPTPSGTMPVASLFTASTGLFDRKYRVTLGDQRSGGFILEGRGWRGSRLHDATNGRRVMNFLSEGDPPDVFYSHLALPEAVVPLSVMLLVAYYFTEREVREGNYYRRPSLEASE